MYKHINAREKLSKFKTQKPQAREGEVLIYGPIVDVALWEDEVTTKSIMDSLEQMQDMPEISVRINSPGGIAFEGLAIHNALKRHPAKIEVHIDAIAASAASIIAMAGDSVMIAENASIMIHEPWTYVLGSMDDLLKEVEVLETIIEQMVKTYGSKSGKDDETLRQIMKAETWYTAEQAKENGFVDEVIQLKNMPKSKADFSIYANVPEWIKEQFDIKSSQNSNQRRCPVKAGTNLAALLNNAIDDQVTEDKSRADVIQEMANAAGIEPGTVNQILNAEINCPPVSRLEGFASVLNVSLAQQISAAESDGCDYSTEEDNAQKLRSMRLQLEEQSL